MIHTKHRIISDNFSLEPTDLTEKKKKYESIALSNQMPVVWEKAKNFSVIDRDGNTWIDMTSGIFVANAGHSNPQICKAVKEQIEKMPFSFLYNTPIRYEFIERLLEISPDHYEKAVLLNSGSEVTDIASKLIKFWAKKNNKKYIVVFNGSYHGRTLGADLMCGTKTSTDWSNLKDNDIHFIDFPYSEEDEFDPSVLPPAAEIAAFFLETYQGWGACMYPDKYMKDLYNYARDIGALVCFDEIQSGFYRMGKLYGYMTYGDYIKPDMICLGKGISSSLPMAAILAKKELIDVDEKAVVGGTHSGNAVCCAASLANINFLTEDKFQQSFQQNASLFEKECERLLDFSIVEKVNCRGMVAGIIFNETEVATRIVEMCILNGVLPVCTFKNSIKLAPPLTITKEAIEESFKVIAQCIEEEDG